MYAYAYICKLKIEGISFHIQRFGGDGVSTTFFFFGKRKMFMNFIFLCKKQGYNIFCFKHWWQMLQSYNTRFSAERIGKSWSLQKANLNLLLVYVYPIHLWQSVIKTHRNFFMLVDFGDVVAALHHHQKQPLLLQFTCPGCYFLFRVFCIHIQILLHALIYTKGYKKDLVFNRNGTNFFKFYKKNWKNEYEHGQFYKVYYFKENFV